MDTFPPEAGNAVIHHRGGRPGRARRRGKDIEATPCRKRDVKCYLITHNVIAYGENHEESEKRLIKLIGEYCKMQDSMTKYKNSSIAQNFQYAMRK